MRIVIGKQTFSISNEKIMSYKKKEDFVKDIMNGNKHIKDTSAFKKGLEDAYDALVPSKSES